MHCFMIFLTFPLLLSNLHFPMQRSISAEFRFVVFFIAARRAADAFLPAVISANSSEHLWIRSQTFFAGGLLGATSGWSCDRGECGDEDDAREKFSHCALTWCLPNDGAVVAKISEQIHDFGSQNRGGVGWSPADGACMVLQSRIRGSHSKEKKNGCWGMNRGRLHGGRCLGAISFSIPS